MITKANARVIKIMENLDIYTDKEAYLQSFRRFGNLFDPLKLASQWVHLRAEFLTDVDLAHIKGGCDLIVAHQSKVEIKHQNIDEFFEEINNLIKDIDDSNLDEFVRSYLIDELNFLVLAIKKFELLGPGGVEVAFGALFAAALRIDGLVKTAWSKRLFGILLVAAAIIGDIGDIDGGIKVIRERTLQAVEYIAKAQIPGLRFIEDKSNQNDK